MICFLQTLPLSGCYEDIEGFDPLFVVIVRSLVRNVPVKLLSRLLKVLNNNTLDVQKRLLEFSRQDDAILECEAISLSGRFWRLPCCPDQTTPGYIIFATSSFDGLHNVYIGILQIGFLS